MDRAWGHTGILSSGHFASFGLGGYTTGMWLNCERTRDIVVTALADAPVPPTEAEIGAGAGYRQTETPLSNSARGTLPLGPANVTCPRRSTTN